MAVKNTQKQEFLAQKEDKNMIFSIQGWKKMFKDKIGQYEHLITHK